MGKRLHIWMTWSSVWLNYDGKWRSGIQAYKSATQGSLIRDSKAKGKKSIQLKRFINAYFDIKTYFALIH